MQTQLCQLALSAALTMNVYAVDATSSATKTLTMGKWRVTEFAAPTQIVYRVSSDSINFPDQHVVFDFIPSRQCVPMPAVMIIKRGAYNPDLDDGRVILVHKLPTQAEVSELTKTAMQRGDTFAFFQFNELTATKLAASNDKGNLAIWVPASFDGTVKRSSNIYFSLEGSYGAIEKARVLCSSNR